MIGLGTLAKIAKGSLSLDEVMEMASAVGMDLTVQNLDEGQLPMAFERAARAASSPFCKVVALRGVTKERAVVEALLVLVPSPDNEKKG